MKSFAILVGCFLYSTLLLAGGTDFVQKKQKACRDRVQGDVQYLSDTDITKYDINVFTSTSDAYIKCALYYNDQKESESFREAATLYDLVSVHMKMRNHSQINTMSLENLKLELLIKLDKISSNKETIDGSVP